MAAGIGTEIEFADGKRVVDDVYAGPIREVTSGHPERFPFRDVMDRLGDYWAKDRIRQFSSRLIGDHLAEHGL